MATLAISIDLPPTGELEISGDGSSPTDAQMAEETRVREKFLASVVSYFEALPKRPPHAQGNVSRVELLGRGVWSQMNHYLLLVTVDIGETGIEQELLAMLPKGSKVSAVGTFESLQSWPPARSA